MIAFQQTDFKRTVYYNLKSYCAIKLIYLHCEYLIKYISNRYTCPPWFSVKLFDPKVSELA